MKSYLVSLSPQGQITIPSAMRKFFRAKKYYLELKNDQILLKPARIFVRPDPQPKYSDEPQLELTKEQRVVLKLLQQKGPLSTEELFYESGFPIEKVNSILGILEICDFIRLLNTGFWETCVISG